MGPGGKIAVAGTTGRVGRHVVEVLEEQGRDVVAISRSAGVDVVSGDDLADAPDGIEAVVDATSRASPGQQAVTEFFTTSRGSQSRCRYGARSQARRARADRVCPHPSPSFVVFATTQRQATKEDEWT